jgi:hypothetical protein
MRSSPGNALFPAQEVSELVKRAQTALSFPAAGRYLNAPRVHAELLARQGFIKPYVPARAFGAADRYAVGDLDQFLERLFAGASPVRKPKANQQGIPAAAKRACCSAADILRLILDRSLKWVGRLVSERGYLSVLVDVEEIRSHVRGSEPAGVTRRPASKILRTNDTVVDALIKAGKLKTFIGRDPVNRCPQILISFADLERFSQHYVSLFQLADERGQHFRRVLKTLDAEGITPVFDPESIGARFYRKREVDNRR